MHIILAALGAIVTILVLVKRLSDAGINLSSLNPLAWRRRRNWQKKYDGNPIFSLKEPLEVAALLATSLAKIDGEVSREEKAILLSLFQSEFGKSEKEASDLLMSSVYLFGDGEDALNKPEKILQSSLEQFSKQQARSVVELLAAIVKIDAANQPEKEQYLARVRSVFDTQFKKSGTW